jgi:hypothetical protein
VLAVGRCDGNKHLGRHEEDHGAYGYDINAEHARHFKFTVAMEHSEAVNHWGYLTEKIVSPFLEREGGWAFWEFWFSPGCWGGWVGAKNGVCAALNGVGRLKN